jgi:hypothetical protein
MHINVTLRRFRVTIAAMEKQWVLHILSVCTVSCLARKGYAPYCHPWPRLAIPYFSTSYKRYGSGVKNVIDHKMCVLIFSTTFVCETFLILRRIQRDITSIINVRMSSCEVPVILVRFKLEFSLDSFEQYIPDFINPLAPEFSFKF